MKRIAILLLFLFSTTFIFGQIIERTENRAKRKANQRVDRKIDQGIDKGLDAVEGLFKKKNKEKPARESAEKSPKEAETEQNNNIMSKMFGGDVDVKDEYLFDHNVLLNIRNFDKKGKESDPMETRLYFSDSESNFGMDVATSEAESFIVYDMETYQMVTLI
ncbi:MAG TPA: hypothetical protein VKY45_03850, partial [Marinilabiliaceae bacterium]|nr:hypothetical protein [Marinilabiliaceae bacterium]